jgi:hypothetical protein
VKVAVEAGGRSIDDCDPLLGNEMKKLVTWKGEETMSVKPGDSFTLHIQLRAAKLFSFEIR